MALAAAVAAEFGGLRDARVAVIEERQQTVRCKGRIVLMREPGTRIARTYSEIALASELPEIRAIGSRSSVLIIQLDNPVLMTDRDDQVAVECWSERVRVGPIVGDLIAGLEEMGATWITLLARFTQNRLARDVEVIEFVPKPLHLQVRIEEDRHVA